MASSAHALMSLLHFLCMRCVGLVTSFASQSLGYQVKTVLVSFRTGGWVTSDDRLPVQALCGQMME